MAWVVREDLPRHNVGLSRKRSKDARKGMGPSWVRRGGKEKSGKIEKKYLMTEGGPSYEEGNLPRGRGLMPQKKGRGKGKREEGGFFARDRRPSSGDAVKEPPSDPFDIERHPERGGEHGDVGKGGFPSD